MKLYKLTDGNDQTYGGCQWGENITHETDGTGELCGPGWIHWYTDPLLAVLLNPIHGRYVLETAHLWEGEGEPEALDRGLKVGCCRATTLRRIELPTVTLEQRARFAILCAKRVYNVPDWVQWADRWLDGSDRSEDAAWAAAEAAAWTAAGVASWSAAEAAARVAQAAAGAAEAAAWAAAGVAQAASRAAWAAAEVAAGAVQELDLIALARQAVVEAPI